MGYPISSAGYLSRAKAALMQVTPDALFYAAFELRCCVETRQSEYVEALNAYKGTKIKPWNIGNTGKRIRQASYADRITWVQYDFKFGKFDSYHTPVSDDLVMFAEKELGQLLHSQPKYRPPEDDWWTIVRAELVRGYRMAWLACQGDSLVPPLWNEKTKKVHPVVLEKNAGNSILFDRLSDLPNSQFKVQIRYLSSPPPHWQCDL